MASRLIINGELFLYGDVGQVGWWSDEGWFDATAVIEALTELSGDINVRLNSGGGVAFEGIAIYNALKAYNGKVTISVDAIAASAASVIAMAGDDIIMRPGSMMMIHDPSSITIGTAEDHEKSAELLNKLADQSVNIYAARTGGNKKHIREMMLDETWMGGDEALKEGFCTSTESADKDEQVAFARFDYRKAYQNTPEVILRAGQVKPPAAIRERGKQMSNNAAAANPAAPVTMQVTGTGAPVVAAAAPVVPQAAAPVIEQSAAVQTIYDRCTAAKLSLDEANTIARDSGGSVERAQMMITDILTAKLAARDPDSSRQQPVPRVHLTADSLDKFKQGVELSLLAKANMNGGERNEFTSLTLREIARECLLMSGSRGLSHDPMLMLQMAFAPRMASGMHSTSDFSSILANVAEKSMMRGYDEAEETFDIWTSVGTMSDFKAVSRVDLNLFPSLAEVPEGAEYTYGQLTDRGVTTQLATYGKMFPITRQAIINDDVGAFTKIPLKMGRAAKRTIGNLVYAILTANAAMADGYNLFSANHSNLGTAGAPSVTTLGELRAKMARQTDPDSHATGGLNIRPGFLLGPVELQDSLQVLMSAQLDPDSGQSKGGARPNSVANMAKVVTDARLSANSTTAYYLAANPNAHDTIEVGYLNGVKTPTLEQRLGWEIDGTEFKVRIDATATVLDFRGMAKNAG